MADHHCSAQQRTRTRSVLDHADLATKAASCRDSWLLVIWTLHAAPGGHSRPPRYTVLAVVKYLVVI